MLAGSIVYSVIIIVIGMVYRKLAVVLNDWEVF